MSGAGQELMEKLGRQDSSDDSDEEDRVSVLMVGECEVHVHV